MFWWGEEDREVVNHLKECGEHLLIVLAWLFSIKVTLAADEFLFGNSECNRDPRHLVRRTCNCPYNREIRY